MDLNEIPESDQISTIDETFDGKSSTCLDNDVGICKNLANSEEIRVFDSERVKIEGESEGLRAKNGDLEGFKENEEMGIGDNVGICKKTVNSEERVKIEGKNEGLRAKNDDFEEFKGNEEVGIGDIDVGIGKKMVNSGERVKIEGENEGLRTKNDGFEGFKGKEVMGIDENDDLMMCSIDELMIENKVLECEKNSALKEVEVWKRRCCELELKVVELESMLARGAGARKSDGGGSGAHESRGTPCIGSPQNLYVSNMSAQSTKMQCSIPVKRQLQFENETGINNKMAPFTPAGARLHIVVDSDDECDTPSKHVFDLESKGTFNADLGSHSDEELPVVGSKTKRDPTVFVSDDEHEVEEALPPRKRIFKVCSSDNDDENDEDGHVIKPKQPFEYDDDDDGEVPIVGTGKTKGDPTVFTSDDEHEVEVTLPRKRSFKVVYNSDNDDEDDDIKLKRFSNGSERDIDDDDDEDDNIPISQLKTKRGKLKNQSPTPRRRRRLVKSEQCVKRVRSQETNNRRRNLGVKYVDDDKGKEECSDSESGSLNSFIVDDDDDDDEEEDAVHESEEDDSVAPEDSSSDDNLDYKDIISRLGRKRSPKTKWELQGDMLAAFAKDPELCMKAVCVLYRQQTNDEKVIKLSLVQNGRGFSKLDASRGTTLGEFLTDGDPDGDMVKTKEELEEHDEYGVKDCVRLAKHYSKQLFEIYQNGEDPYFN